MSLSLEDRFFPFHRLGLQRNPFGTLTPDEWFEVTVPPPPIEAALRDGFDHLLVLGRQGRGKSTALNYLRYHFARQGQSVAYERLPRGRWHYTTDTRPLDVFALDEMQRLVPWAALRLIHEMGAKRLIMGSHADHRPLFALRGLHVITVRLGVVASRERLALILQRRLDVFAYGNGAQVAFSEAALDVLWSRYGADLRTMTFHLYDVFQRLDTPKVLLPADLDLS